MDFDRSYPRVTRFSFFTVFLLLVDAQCVFAWLYLFRRAELRRKMSYIHSERRHCIVAAQPTNRSSISTRAVHFLQILYDTVLRCIAYSLRRQLGNCAHGAAHGDGVRRHFKHLNVVVAIAKHGELV